jgi:hypothetical protein
LRLTDDDHLVLGPGEKDRVGVGEVRQKWQVTGDVVEQRAILRPQARARLEWVLRLWGREQRRYNV